MQNSKIKTTIIVLSFLLFAGTVGIIISMHKIDKQTADSAALYTATVKSADIIDTEKNISAEIHTKEYDTSLYVSVNICKNINTDDIKNLKNGQKIFFRIENSKAKQMNKVDFLDIVSLKTDSKEIFSLEEYNRLIHKSAYPARIAGGIAALSFLLISLLTYLSGNKNKTDPNGWYIFE